MKLQKIALVRFAEDLYDDPLGREEEVMLVYFAGAVRASGFDVTVYDFQIDRDASLAVLANEDFALIAVCIRLPGTNLNTSLDQVRLLRRWRPDLASHITLIGHTGSIWPDFTFGFPTDSVLFGEEAELIQLAQAITTEGELSIVKGLAYKSNGEVKFNELPEIQTPVQLPPPYHYHLQGIQDRGLSTHDSVIPLQTARGCYGLCKFCFLQAYRKLGGYHVWRPRPIEHIVEEIQEAIETYPGSYFRFSDMEMVGPGERGRQRTIQFAKAIVARGLKISFMAYVRADRIDDEMLSTLKQAGLTTLFVGIESFSQAALDRFGKETDVGTNLRAIDSCLRHGIFLHMGFIPFDRLTSVPELLANLRELRDLVSMKPWMFPVTQFIYNPIVPLPNTATEIQYARDGSPSASEILGHASNLSPALNTGAAYEFADHRVALVAAMYRALVEDVRGNQLCVRTLLQRIPSDTAFQGADVDAGLRWLFGLSALMTQTVFASAVAIAEAEEPGSETLVQIETNRAILSAYRASLKLNIT
jgi:hypothetical protein